MTAVAPPMLPTQRLDGRHAIVTGAGRGIGRATALALAEAGASVTLFSRSEDELAAVADEVRERGVRAEMCVGDVRSPPDVERLVEAAAAADEGLSICVTAAGLNRPGPTLEQPIEDFDLVVDTNLRGTYLTCRAFAAAVEARGRGGANRRDLVADGRGRIPRPSGVLREQARCERARQGARGRVGAGGIAVNAVAPTFVDTPLTRPMFEDETFRADVLRRLPMGRIGTPSDVVGAVVYLASDQASLVTGHVLAVDGGWTAW